MIFVKLVAIQRDPASANVAGRGQSVSQNGKEILVVA
jgi:hypothetical protein